MEDHVKIVLYGEGHPTVDMELTNAAAYPQDRWHIMATAGGLRGTTEHLEWKWLDWSKMPRRSAERAPAEGRKYQAEALNWEQATWDAPPDTLPAPVLFYRDLHDAVRAGKPHPITPQSVRRLIAVMDACRELCPV
jgi:hypothetical protein